MNQKYAIFDYQPSTCMMRSAPKRGYGDNATLFFDVTIGNILAIASGSNEDRIDIRESEKFLNKNKIAFSRIANSSIIFSDNSELDKGYAFLFKKLKADDVLMTSKRLSDRVKSICSESLAFSLTLPNFRKNHSKEDAKIKCSFVVGFGDLRYREISLDIDDLTTNLQIFNSKKGAYQYLDMVNGKIKYSNDIKINENGLWKEDGRQEVKISKIIKSLISPESIEMSVNGVYYSNAIDCDYIPNSYESWIDDGLPGATLSPDIDKEQAKDCVRKAIARFYELVATELKPKSYNIQLTDDIESVYKIENSGKKIGTLSGSCMAAHNVSRYECAKSSSFYNKLTKKFDVKVLYATEKDKLIGRAIVWHNMINSKDGEKFNFVDRIYGTEDFVSVVIEWAYNNGYYRKNVQSFSNSSLRDKAGHEISYYSTGKISLNISESIGGIPYFDTLKFAKAYSNKKRGLTVELSSWELDNSRIQKIQHTASRPIGRKCGKCGRIMLFSEINDARSGNSNYYTMSLLCTNCGSTFDGIFYESNSEDIELSHSTSVDTKCIPIWAKDRALYVNINGNDEVFDVEDRAAIGHFVHKKAEERAAELVKKQARKKKRPIVASRPTVHVVDGNDDPLNLHFTDPNTNDDVDIVELVGHDVF